MADIIRVGNFLVVKTGKLASTSTCCCYDEGCLIPSEWRIVDAADNLYAKGPVAPDGSLVYLPDPWTPVFYFDPAIGGLLLSMSLQVFGCSDGWDTIESWNTPVTLCADVGGRFDYHSFAPPWTPPAKCRCKNQTAVDLVNALCEPCPDLVIGAPAGSGQEWRDPQPGAAYKFTGAIDGEWTNLLNWEDAAGETPASSLPNASSTVSIAGHVRSSSVDVYVYKMYLRENGVLSVSALVEELDSDQGTINSDGDCPCDSVNPNCEICTVVTVTGHAYFLASEIVDAQINASNFPVEISYSNLAATGIINGDAKFAANSKNYGVVTGDAEFSGNSGSEMAENFGQINNNAKFTQWSQNAGYVKNDAEFDENAINIGVIGALPSESGCNTETEKTGTGNATFSMQSQNGVDGGSDGSVSGNAEFDDDAKNYWEVVGDAVFNNFSENRGEVGGSGVFNDASKNYGHISCGAEFNDESENHGTVEDC